jgi:ketosteroid isomerase-like protein
MKRHMLVPAALILAFAASACSPAVPQAASSAGGAAAGAAATAVTEDVEAVITQLERHWAAAIVKKDAAVLDRMLAEEFNGTSPTAHTFNKGFAVEDLKSGKYAVASMDLDEISVNPYGDVAVAFTSQKEKSEYAGKDTSGHYHFTDVWARKGGRWQVVASHGSRFNEGH